MNIESDYHLHTHLCGHAQGRPEDYAQSALKKGLREIGFSDHAPLLTREEPSITMTMQQLPHYHRMLEELKATYAGELCVKIGIEADYLDGYQNKTRAMLEAYPYDYVIGSVHYMGNWGFDNTGEMKRWKEKDVNTVFRSYYSLLRDSARSRLFDVMAHVDLVKKFGHRPTEDLAPEIEKTAKVFKKNAMVIEINTSGLRKPVHEIYPALDALTIYHREGVAITFGSDSHAPDEVAADFDRALDWARQAGYKEYVLFNKRRIAGTVNIGGE